MVTNADLLFGKHLVLRKGRRNYVVVANSSSDRTNADKFFGTIPIGTTRRISYKIHARRESEMNGERIWFGLNGACAVARPERVAVQARRGRIRSPPRAQVQF